MLSTSPFTLALSAMTGVAKMINDQGEVLCVNCGRKEGGREARRKKRRESRKRGKREEEEVMEEEKAGGIQEGKREKR